MQRRITNFRAYLQGLGSEMSPQMVQGTQRFFAGHFPGVDSATAVTRDHQYGPDARHRLDIFTAAARENAPVLVFVHGGGFVMGDKRTPDLPFYDNIGDFAVRCGWVGVTLTYRLAPAHRWPAGSEDLALAVRWLRANITAHGGDPSRIFLIGQSAGAVHVAGYVVRFADDAGIAGALMISGLYDVAAAEPNPFHLAYYGEAREAWSQCSTLDGLTRSRLPLFFSVSEFDIPDFQKQAALLASSYTQARGRFPQLHWLAGHNHLSPVLAIGTPADTLGPLIQNFIATAEG